MGAYHGRDPLEVVDQCARNGTWVFISSLKFPSYWQKLVAMLRKLHDEDLIQKNFRLFIDLQGYTQNEIPDSFLFDKGLSFYLNDKNNSSEIVVHG